jgi:steroid delta-isomerase-like uncharacterized protein
MKMRIECGLVVSLLTAAAVLTTPIKSAIAQDCTEQLAKDFLVGWSHDLPKLMPLFTDNVVYDDTTVHTVLHGKDELRGFAEGWFKAFPDISFAFTSAVISGDRAAVAWQVTGTQKGDMPGMPASNKAVNVAGVSLMECAGGKIKHNVDYWDMATTMRQLGFLPPPATN